MTRMRPSEDIKHGRIYCIAIAFLLIDRMNRGDEIIFADEYGTWMIPSDEKVFIRAYLRSLSAVSTPEEFVEAAMPLLERDSHESSHNKVYETAIQASGKEQKKALESAVRSLKARTI